MFEHKMLRSLDEYFQPLSARREKGIFFYRINGYSEEIRNFLRRYYETARQRGVVLEGKIPNPDEKNLSYYEEIMGLSFRLDFAFIRDSLGRWLPRMTPFQREQVAAAMFHTLETLRNSGKNDNMLKNAYIKFMCWLYYRFEPVVNQLGADSVPKILYEGEISSYELQLLAVLSQAGCDVVLLQYHGDAAYLRTDGASAWSYPYPMDGLGGFPEGFSVKTLREDMEKEIRRQRLYGPLPQMQPCVNAWITGQVWNDIAKKPSERGADQSYYYTFFGRVHGVDDKRIWLNERYQFYRELKRNGRQVLILEKQIPSPGPDEVQQIQRSNYNNLEQMLMHLAGNIRGVSHPELARILTKAFVDTMLEEAEREGTNLNKLTGKAVYLLCWLKRYQKELFAGWKFTDVGCLIYLGGCQTENEAMFLRFLARTPVDVLILLPEQGRNCCLCANTLYEKHEVESLYVEHFPTDDRGLRVGTAAYHAERELDTIMYQDSGMYRNQQYRKAVSITLQTMYEEIAILWDQEMKYRPSFSVVENTVHMPVIFAKVSGVKEGNVSKYWSDIRALNTEDTFLIRRAPYLQGTDLNPLKPHATEFFRNGRLQKERIKAHPAYQYGILREEIQDHILEKLQQMIDQKIIRGTLVNGMEYTIISTVLNMNKELVRMLQKFDFTKKNPKLIYIHATEAAVSLEDSILVAFLNLVGFDVVVFTPTGYQSVERYYNQRILDEHQIGEYLYDLVVPSLEGNHNDRSGWQKIFKRGN